MTKLATFHTFDISHFDTEGFVVEDGVTDFSHCVKMGIARGVFLPLELDFEVFGRLTRAVSLIFGSIDI